MNIFNTQPVRAKYGISTDEEYIVGMIKSLGGMSTTRVLSMAKRHKIMSPATAHKYLKAAVGKKLLLQRWDQDDKRNTEFTVSARGEKLLEELKHAYVGK
jgi:DNA-binding MarR family transcriptional regulator